MVVPPMALCPLRTSGERGMGDHVLMVIYRVDHPDLGLAPELPQAALRQSIKLLAGFSQAVRCLLWGHIGVDLPAFLSILETGRGDHRHVPVRCTRLAAPLSEVGGV